ncbi:MAG: hypothetical protein IPL86_19365 [Flavobacteriales bacterium]|nr:hypothetical protein [Flavobacteriales bacterium]
MALPLRTSPPPRKVCRLVHVACPADIVASTAKVYAFFVNTAGDDVSDSQLAAFN